MLTGALRTSQERSLRALCQRRDVNPCAPTACAAPPLGLSKLRPGFAKATLNTCIYIRSADLQSGVSTYNTCTRTGRVTEQTQRAGVRRFPRALFVSPSASYKRAPVAPACSGRGLPCACVTPPIAVPCRSPPGMWEWPFAVRNWHATGIIIAICAKQTAPIPIGASGMHQKSHG